MPAWGSPNFRYHPEFYDHYVYVYNANHAHKHRGPSSDQHPCWSTHSADRQFRTEPQECRNLRV